MKKIKEILKKITFLISGFCVSIYAKVYAIVTQDPQPWYGVPPEPKSSKVGDVIYVICKIVGSLIIPIVFIIGTIIYIKRSSSSTIRKIITIIIALIIVVLVCLGINHIISNI